MNDFQTHGVTDFLLAMPSFFSGYGSAVDFMDTFLEFNQSLTPEQADALALRQDWLVVGDDLRRAMRVFEARQRSGAR